MKLGTDGMLLGAWARVPHDVAVRACDVGTGCGIVALLLAHRYPGLDITGVDIDHSACCDAAVNFACSPWDDRLHSVCTDITEDMMGGGYDMVVSNPPYFHTGERAPGQARATARHADTLSADWLVEHAGELLASCGTLSLIVPATDEERLIERAAFARMYPRRICRVSSVEGKAPIRLLMELARTDGPTEVTTMALRHADGSPTADYIKMFKDYYLHL